MKPVLHKLLATAFAVFWVSSSTASTTDSLLASVSHELCPSELIGHSPFSSLVRLELVVGPDAINVATLIAAIVNKQEVSHIGKLDITALREIPSGELYRTLLILLGFAKEELKFAKEEIVASSKEDEIRQLLNSHIVKKAIAAITSPVALHELVLIDSLKIDVRGLVHLPRRARSLHVRNTFVDIIYEENDEAIESFGSFIQFRETPVPVSAEQIRLELFRYPKLRQIRVSNLNEAIKWEGENYLAYEGTEVDSEFLAQSNFIKTLQTDTNSWHEFLAEFINEVNQCYARRYSSFHMNLLRRPFRVILKLMLWRQCYEDVLEDHVKSGGFQVVDLEDFRIAKSHAGEPYDGPLILDKRYNSRIRLKQDFLRQEVLGEGIIWWDRPAAGIIHGMDPHIFQVAYVRNKFDKKYGTGALKRFLQKGAQLEPRSQLERDLYYVCSWIRNFDFIEDYPVMTDFRYQPRAYDQENTPDVLNRHGGFDGSDGARQVMPMLMIVFPGIAR